MFLRTVSRFLAALFMISAVYADPIVTGSKPFTFIPGTVISSSQVNADFDYIINQVNTNAAKNGANSSITALLGLTTPIPPASGGSSIYRSGVAGGTANAITVTSTVPAISSYSLVAGNFVLFKAGLQNTAATTLDVNSTGAVNIVKQTTNGLVSLQGGDILVNNIVFVYYDGTNYVLLNNAQLFGQSASFASAATVDLGLAQSHNVSITGTTPITSFGSSGNVGLPLYYIRFTAATTITYNVTSLITPSASNILTAAGDTAWIEYLGSGNWRVNSYTPAVNVPSLESVNNLLIVNNAGTPTTSVDVTASAAIVCTTSAYCLRTPAVSFTINAATTGANALDTGALANNTWYYIYIISDGVNTAGLASTSTTAPTMPAGYTYKYRIGAIRTLGAATFIRIRQVGNNANYVVVAASTTPNLPIITSGNTGNPVTPTFTTTSISNYAPTTARIFWADYVMNNTSGTGIIAPTATYAGVGSATNPAPCATGNGSDTVRECRIVLESTNIFYASLSSGTALLLAHGWTDAVNAN